MTLFRHFNFLKIHKYLIIREYMRIKNIVEEDCVWEHTWSLRNSTEIWKSIRWYFFLPKGRKIWRGLFNIRGYFISRHFYETQELPSSGTSNLSNLHLWSLCLSQFVIPVVIALQSTNSFNVSLSSYLNEALPHLKFAYSK